MPSRLPRNRSLWFLLSILFALMLILLSANGQLQSLESVVTYPLTVLSGVLNRIAVHLIADIEDLSELRYLRQRVSDLEELVGQYQNEQIAIYEIQRDFENMATLLNYSQTNQEANYLAAEVVASEASGLFRGIILNRGSRDGVAVGMPVVTERGLVGRVIDARANNSQVLLITDANSAVSARLQSSRAQGSVLGQAGGSLRMTFIPIGSVIQVNDIITTSGLGGSMPADLVIGQVSSIREFEFELFLEAEVNSLVDFASLEYVLVITNFLPEDLSVFESENGR